MGSIYGIGLVNKSANSREITTIGLSWLLTLPVAAILSALLYAGIRAMCQAGNVAAWLEVFRHPGKHLSQGSASSRLVFNSGSIRLQAP